MWGCLAAINGVRKSLITSLGTSISVQVVSVKYDSTNVRTLIRHPNSYFANLQAGVDWTDTFLTAQVAKCPDQQIVLAGYSQGAC
ncbi:MAG TPA: cutinase family protein [Streptosporangiaceae bacterium]|nr:cutinase family protein [Streptosporangiaceae bacterium]